MKIVSFILIGCAGFFCHSVTGADLPKELSKIEKEISQTKQSINLKEEQKNKISKQINQLDEAIKQNNIKIKQIVSEKRKNQAEQIKIKNEINEIQLKIAQTKQKIAKLLNYQYRNQYPSAIVLLMKNEDLNEKSRRLGYLKYFQKSQQEVYNDLFFKEKELVNLEVSLNKKIQDLTLLANQQQILLNNIQNDKNKQLKLQQILNASISKEKKNLETLQASEIKLNNMMKAILVKQKQAKQVANISTNKKTESITKTKPQINGNLTAEDINLTQAERSKIIESSESISFSNFSNNKGNLSLPAKGTIVQYYGSKREDGGIVKGIVIKSPLGNPVSSVAQGKVMFAGEMTNFGKTVIIAHDDVYATIYNGLSAIKVSLNQSVGKNTIIGNTGQLYNGDTGVYFELRENSRAINPKSWFK